jgi:hypothetical protein
MVACPSEDRQAVVDVINAYAHALDERSWQSLDDVFVSDAVARYGTPDSRPLVGRNAIVVSIRTLLEGCGPSQHLLGNHMVNLDGDVAVATCKARVFHYGAGARATLVPYEVFGVYRDRLRRDRGGWRITERLFDVQLCLGDPSVLGPVPETA